MRFNRGIGIHNLVTFTFHRGQASCGITYNCLKLRKDFSDKVDGRRDEEEQEHIYAYVQTFNYLPNLYAIDDVIAKATTQTEIFEQRPGQIALELAKSHKDKALSCGDAFLEQGTETIFVERVPLNVRDNITMSWAARLAVHYHKLGQNADTPLHFDGGTLSSSTK